MDSITDPQRHGIGGNNPPDPIEELRARLADTHAPLVARCNELLGMEGRLPAEMDDEWEAKVTEAIKSCTKFSRNSEVTRLEANEPHRALIAATDGFFKSYSDKVDALKRKLTSEYLTPYQQKKAAAEKARREAEAAEARRRQEEEARRAREEVAALAEARRKEREAKEAAERAEREARDAAARAERERQDAERQAAEAKNKREREAAEKARREAEARAATERAKVEEEARKARELEEAAAAERREQERQAKEAKEAADKAKADKAKAETSAGARAADMSRTRTDLGAVASLRTTWKHRVVDADKVPRIYLSVHEPAIVAAIRAATTKDGKCELKIEGVEIYPVTDSVVR